MPVAVPNLIGLGSGEVETLLDSLKLRYVQKFPFDANGSGAATEQSPAAGTQVPLFSTVTITFPVPLGPLDDRPGGPTPSGSVEGRVASVSVSMGGASMILLIDGQVPVPLSLYRDPSTTNIPHVEWMRRGAVLGLAQRALTNAHIVSLDVRDSVVLEIEIHNA